MRRRARKRPVRGRKCNKARRQHDVRQRQHTVSAMPIDNPPDRRAGKSGKQQSAQEGCENPRPRHTDAGTNRTGKNGGQVTARSPGKRLRHPKRTYHEQT